jgi:5-methylcytosine-specific restriction endonuclease McrA
MRYRDKCLKAKGEQCVECGATEDIEVHHVDGDRLNNRLENLVPLCHGCHVKVHSGDLPHWSKQIENHPLVGKVSDEEINEAFSNVDIGP